MIIEKPLIGEVNVLYPYIYIEEIRHWAKVFQSQVEHFSQMADKFG